MKIAALGDLHLGVRGGHPAFMDFQIDWIRDHFIPAAQAAGVQKVVQVGDALDVRAHTSNLLLHRIIHELAPAIRDSGMEWVFLVGNHNIFYRDNNEVHSLAVLEAMKLPNVRIVREYEEDGELAYCGWLNKNNADVLLEHVFASKAKFLFGHFEPADLPYYKGIMAKDGIDIKLFKHFELVVSGHYHTVSRSGNYVNIGSPYHLSWACFPDGTNRGWFLLDTEFGTCEIQRNREDQTMFQVFMYDKDTDYSKGAGAAAVEALKGRIVKVMVTERGANPQFNAFKKALSQAQCLDYNIMDQTIVVAEKVEVSEEVLKTSSIHVLENYIEGQENIDSDVKTRVKALALRMYEKVKQ